MDKLFIKGTFSDKEVQVKLVPDLIREIESLREQDEKLDPRMREDDKRRISQLI